MNFFTRTANYFSLVLRIIFFTSGTDNYFFIGVRIIFHRIVN